MPTNWLLMDKTDPDGGQFRTRLAGAGRHRRLLTSRPTT